MTVAVRSIARSRVGCDTQRQMSLRAPTRAAPPPRAAPGGALVRVEGVQLGYWVRGRFETAVARASFEIAPREKMMLIGPSGCGKSTLLKAIAGFIAPARGSIEVAGRPTLGPGPDRAVVFQELDQLFPWRTVLDNVAYPLRVNGRDARTAVARAREYLALTKLSKAADRYPHQLSGGMRQRVMIAMALALEPQIVIMDEPTTALDVVTQREILEELMELRERLGFAVLFITHDLSLLVEIADSIAVMYAGRLVEQATAEALYQAPRHPYTLGLLHSFPALHGPRKQMTGIPGSPPDLRALPDGCVFHPRCPYVMDRCVTQSPPLLVGAGRRVAACWLHDGTGPVPAELAKAEPGGSQAGAPAAAGAGRKQS